jgi:hypothetical protein
MGRHRCRAIALPKHTRYAGGLVHLFFVPLHMLQLQLALCPTASNVLGTVGFVSLCCGFVICVVRRAVQQYKPVKMCMRWLSSQSLSI